jgi:hypothetical protein
LGKEGRRKEGKGIKDVPRDTEDPDTDGNHIVGNKTNRCGN